MFGTLLDSAVNLHGDFQRGDVQYEHRISIYSEILYQFRFVDSFVC